MLTYPPGPVVTVNCMCQRDWTMGCPGSWLHVILGVSGMVILDEISILISKVSEANCFSQCDGRHPILRRSE